MGSEMCIRDRDGRVVRSVDRDDDAEVGTGMEGNGSDESQNVSTNVHEAEDAGMHEDRVVEEGRNARNSGPP